MINNTSTAPNTVQAALELQEKVIKRVVNAGHDNPLDPKATYNQIAALQNENVFLPIVDFVPLHEGDIRIDQVTVHETSDERTSSLRAEFAKRRKHNPNRPSMAAPPIVRQNPKTKVNDLHSGHNRKSVHFTDNPGMPMGTIIVGPAMRFDGKPLTESQRAMEEFKLAVAANPQQKNRPYTKPDCAKIVYNFATKHLKTSIPNREEVSAIMDRVLPPGTFPRKADRTSIWKEVCKLNGTWTFLDVSVSDIASAIIDAGYTDPRVKKRDGTSGKALAGVRKGNPIIQNVKTKMNFLFISTDTSGTHLENAFGVLATDFNKDPKNSPFAKDVSEAILNNQLNGSKRATLPAVISLQIGNPAETYNKLHQQRRDAVNRIKELNVVLRNCNIPVVFEEVVFPRQLDLDSDQGLVVELTKVLN